MLIFLEEDDTISTCNCSSSLLVCLKISQCPSLKSLIPMGELPATLILLEIKFCSKLESIAMRFPHNSSLEKFVLEHCEILKSLPMGIHSFNHLNMIEIRWCPTLISFPYGGLLPGNLKELTINDMAQPNYLRKGGILTQKRRNQSEGIFSILFRW
jgi:hypothetical protein